jgi:hypothetical protein
LKTKQQKRTEAEARARVLETMTIDERLAEIAKRPGESQREKERIARANAGASRSK